MNSRISTMAASSVGSDSRLCALRSVTISVRLCAPGAAVVRRFAQACNNGVFRIALLIVTDEQPAPGRPPSQKIPALAVRALLFGGGVDALEDRLGLALNGPA